MHFKFKTRSKVHTRKKVCQKIYRKKIRQIILTKNRKKILHLYQFSSTTDVTITCMSHRNKADVEAFKRPRRLATDIFKVFKIRPNLFQLK